MTLTITPDDTARTRLTDPLTSHLAGDLSQVTKSDVKAAVLWLFGQTDRATGSQINELYREFRDERRWPHVHIDSPRKRTGELFDDGLLVVVEQGHGRNAERSFALKPTKEPTT